MNVSEIETMTDEEIFKLSLEKNKVGCATKDALKAQRIIYERSGAFCRKVSVVTTGKRDRSAYGRY